jgi:APA family basic amino acid/polyamine antiporter
MEPLSPQSSGRVEPASQVTESSITRPTLLRALGPATAIALVVGGVIGSGVFAKPGTIAAQGLGFGWIISAWVVGGVLCLLGALCFAELGAMLPRAGGPYVYLREAYGRVPAFLYGWGEIFFNRPGGVGALGTFFVVALLKMLGWDAGIWVQIGMIVVLIALLGWVNVLGVIWGGRVQNVTTWIKAGGVALVAVLPFVLQAVNGATVDPANYASTLTASAASQAGADRSWIMQFGAIMLAVMWAYHGWSGFTPVAEEIREPQRNIPLALLGGMGIVMLLYVSANVAYHGVLPMNELAAAGQNGANVMAGRLVGEWGTVAITAIIMCSTFGAMNSNLLLSPRVAFAMGRDGTFLRSLGEVHVIYRTPAVAIVVQSLMAIALVVASGLVTIWAAGLSVRDDDPYVLRELLTRLKNKSVFDLLTNFVVFASGLFEALCVLGMMVLRVRQPELPRPYRTWGYPLVPALYLLCFGAFLTVVFLAEPFEALAGLTLIALGLPLYLLTLRGVNRGSGPTTGADGEEAAR